MADPYADALERARRIQSERAQEPADTSAFDALERARNIQAQRDAEPAPQQTSPDHLGLVNRMPLQFSPDAMPPSGPAAEGIPTRGEHAYVDPNLRRQPLAFSRGAVTGLPIVGPSAQSGLDRFASMARGEDLATIQREGEQLRREFPGTTQAGELFGAVAGTAPLVAAAPSAFIGRAGAGLVERAATAFGTNAALAGTDLAARGRSTDEVVQGAAVAGVVGAVLTPWLARIGGERGGQIANRIEGQPNSVAAERLAEQANQLYASARQSGIGISPRAFGTLSQNISRAMDDANFSQRFVPQAIRAVQGSIDDAVAANKVIPLERLELLRQEIVPLTRGATPELASTRRLAGLVLQQIDDFGSNLGRRGYPISVSSTASITPQQQQAGLRSARDLWRQQRNVSRIDEALRLAENSPSGLASGIRQEFSRLSRDRKWMAGLNDTERRAIRDMASFANFRGAGMILAKMDPSRSNLRMMALLGGGGLAGGPAGIAAAGSVMLAGRGAAAVTGRAMTRRAEDVRRTLAGQPRRISQTGRTIGAIFGVTAAQEAGE